MSWLWKKKEAAPEVAAVDPANRVSTVAPELPILDIEAKTVFYDPFCIEQRKKDLSVAPQFAAERAAFLHAKANGLPLVPASAAAAIVPEPSTPATAGEEAPAEEWADDSTASPTGAAGPTSPTFSPSDEAELVRTVEEERAKVDQMAAMLGIELPDAAAGHSSAQRRYKLELDLLRFLHARKMSVPDAAVMYKAAEEWFDAEKLREKDVLSTPDPLVRYFQTISPHRNHGFDYFGNPVYYERTGMVVVGDMLKHMTEDDIVRRHLRYMLYSLDRMAVSSIASGKNVERVVMIHDLAHLKFSVETAGVRIFKKTVTFDQNYFPERLHRAFIINAPMSFRGAWALVKPLLDVKTQEKIIILGANYKEALLECIPPSQLPAHYGGLCQCSFENDPLDFCLPHKVRRETDPENEHNPEWPLIVPRSEEQFVEAKIILAKAAAAAGAASSQ